MQENFEISTGKKTKGEFTIKYQENGYGAVIPVIDGTPHPELLMSYASDADRDAGLRLLEEALHATLGNIPAAMRYMYEAAMHAAKGIKADEAVDIDGYEIVIDHAARKAYWDTKEVANMDDMECELPRDAVKKILSERAARKIEEIIDEEDDDDDYWDEGCPLEDASDGQDAGDDEPEDPLAVIRMRLF